MKRVFRSQGEGKVKDIGLRGFVVIGTGHQFGANSLIYREGSFNSLKAMRCEAASCRAICGRGSPLAGPSSRRAPTHNSRGTAKN